MGSGLNHRGVRRGIRRSTHSVAGSHPRDTATRSIPSLERGRFLASVGALREWLTYIGRDAMWRIALATVFGCASMQVPLPNDTALARGLLFVGAVTIGELAGRRLAAPPGQHPDLGAAARCSPPTLAAPRTVADRRSAPGRRRAPGRSPAAPASSICAWSAARTGLVGGERSVAGGAGTLDGSAWLARALRRSRRCPAGTSVPRRAQSPTGLEQSGRPRDRGSQRQR